VSANPHSYRSHLLLANFAAQRNDYETARSEYHAAVALRPLDPEVRLLYIRLLETAKDEPQALKEASQAVVEFPSNPELNFHLGELVLESGDAEAAVAYFEQSLKANPQLDLARVGLADSYAKVGRINDAIRAITQVLNTDTDGTLHYRLGRWYQQSGRKREAQAAFAVFTRLKDRADQAKQKELGRSCDESN
jgi:predicted Zn-dependent protease